MAKPKKPKLSKLPKRPKASASVDVWTRFHEKVKAIDKKNAEKVSEYNKKIAKIKSDKTKKLGLISKSVKLKEHKFATL